MTEFAMQTRTQAHTEIRPSASATTTSGAAAVVDSRVVSEGLRSSEMAGRAGARVITSGRAKADTTTPGQGTSGADPWNNGKEVPRLDLTSSTTPGQQIHKFDHIRTANPCDWLLFLCDALPLVGCHHSLVYLHLPVVEGLIFCISATPHLGTSFPLFHVST